MGLATRMRGMGNEVQREAVTARRWRGRRERNQNRRRILRVHTAGADSRCCSRNGIEGR